MADEKRSFDPGAVSSNRAQQQGSGVGQEEMDKQLSPSRDAHATDPQRTEPFDESLDPAPDAGRPGEALDDRNAASLDDGQAQLGAGTPAGVDVHDLGDDDNPQEDWGEAVEAGALHSADHTRRPIRTEAERGQGAKTRRLNKDIVSRRT